MGLAAGLIAHAGDETRSHPVHHAVGGVGGNDFAAQAVRQDGVFQALLHGLREIPHQIVGQARIVRQIGFDQVVVDRDFAVSQQDRDLRPGEAAAGLPTLLEHGVAGQEFEPAVEPVDTFEVPHQFGLAVEQLDTLEFDQADRLALQVIVAQYQLGHIVRHVHQNGLASRLIELAAFLGRTQRDFDVHLVVRAVHTARIVDEIGIEPAAPERVFDPPELGHAEVGAFADHLGPQLGSVDPEFVVATVADLGMGLVRGFDEGADAAKKEQVDFGREQRPDQFGRGAGFADQPEQLLDRWRHRQLFGRPLVNRAAFGKHRAVVVVPGRTRQIEKALPFGERSRRIRIRVDEDVHVVEGADQPHGRRKQHAVAEHVARHVAHTYTGEGFGLAIAAHLTEMAFDRFPAAAGGDGHLFVVITERAARGEGVAQPEAVFRRHPVGDVRKGRGAFVGRHHQIRIVAVAAHHLARRDHHRTFVVVGHIQQTAHQGFVTLDAFAQHLVAVAANRRLLDDEPAFGAHRHDHRVFDHLRFHEAEDFGAEILQPVRPADAATRHLAAAQVHGFHPRRIHPDLEHRPRFGQIEHLGRIELEGDVGLDVAVFVLLPTIGAQGRLHQIEETAQDAVFIQAAHRLEVTQDLRQDHLLAVDAVLARRIKKRLEELDQPARHLAVAGQRLLHVGLAESGTGLAQVFAVGAQHHHLTPGQVGLEHQLVEAVAFDFAAVNPLEGVFETGMIGVFVEPGPILDQGFEVAHPHLFAGSGRIDLEGILRNHPQAHVFEHRQDVRKWAMAAQLEGAQVETVVPRAVDFVEAQGKFARFQGFFDLRDVERGVDRRHELLVRRRKGAGIPPPGEAPGIVAARTHQRLPQLIAPGADGLGQSFFDLLDHKGRDLPRGGFDDVLQLRHRTIGDAAVGGRHLTAEHGFEDVLDFEAHLGRVALARHINQAGHEPFLVVAAHQKRQARPQLQLEDTQREVVEVVLADLEQLVARVFLDNVAQRLGVVAVGQETRPFHHPLHLAAHQRDLAGADVVGHRGEEAQQLDFAVELAVVGEAFEGDHVHVHRPVHPRALARLEDHHQIAAVQESAGIGSERLLGAGLELERQMAQKTEAGAAVGFEEIFAVDTFEVVFEVTEEGEVVAHHPFEELDGLLQLIGLHRRFVALEALDRPLAGLLHRLVIADHRFDVGQDLPQVGFQLDPFAGRRKPVDLELHERFVLGAFAAGLQDFDQLARGVAFGRQLGMQHQVDGQLAAAQLGRHRIDQEGHVGGQDLDDRVVFGPGGTVVGGIEDADLGGVVLPARGPFEQGKQHAGEAGEVGLAKIVERKIFETFAHQYFGDLALIGGDRLEDGADHLFDLSLFFFDCGQHGGIS